MLLNIMDIELWIVLGLQCMIYWVDFIDAIFGYWVRLPCWVS